MLEDLRERLTAIDLELIELVARRQEIVEQIGQAKHEAGRATRDFAREKQVIDLARERASALGISPDVAQSVMQLLIGQSLQKQEQDRLARVERPGASSALILGGAGQMGRWFGEFLSSQGFDIAVADPSSVAPPFRVVDSWREQLATFEIIVVATPIQTTAQILSELADLRPDALIFDISSLKTPLRQSLGSLADAGCRVTSLHPMFGPKTSLLSGRHVIFCDVGNTEAVTEARALFAPTMAEQIVMGLEDHDRLIAYVLGLSHALNIAFFTALRESGEAAKTLAQMSSTTFDAQLNIASNVAKENPHLYFEIQRLNDYRSAPMGALQSAIHRLAKMVESNDETGFVKLMESGKKYLSDRQP